MKKLWKPFAEWATALRSSFAPDIFTRARIKIAFLYLLMGLIIFVVGGYLIYGHILSIIQTVLGTIQQKIAQNATLDAPSTASVITQAIKGEIQKMNLAVGFWMILTMLVAAYILANVTLIPLKEAMERKQRFAVNISHELRTPLSVMRTNSEVALLNVTEITGDEITDILKGNLEEIDRMSKIIKFLLLHSNFENHLVKPEIAPVDVSQALANSVKLLKNSAEEKNVALSFSTAGQSMISGNSTALEEMFTNLIKNALAYTPEGGSVRVSIFRRRRGEVIVFIEDTGIGIPAADLPKIFEPFYRGENAYSQRNKKRGTGIGLAIVKEIAALHKATIHVSSQLGKGTRISIKFSKIHLLL